MARGSSIAGTIRLAECRRRLLNWFHQNQRKLPCRGERDPYRILVSEVMLQQTRVAVVEDRYRTFLAKFPTAQRLAGAREEAVLAAWGGVGYYRRGGLAAGRGRGARGPGRFPRV